MNTSNNTVMGYTSLAIIATLVAAAAIVVAVIFTFEFVVTGNLTLKNHESGETFIYVDAGCFDVSIDAELAGIDCSALLR